MSQAALNTRNSEEEVSSRRNNGTRLAGILFLLTVLTTVLVSGWVVLGWMEDAQRLPLSKLVLTGERHYTRNDDIRQSILALGEPGTFMTQEGRAQYRVEAPDALEPADKKGMRLYRYSDTSMNAGVAYDGKQRIIVLGFPFESIIGEAERAGVMRGVMNFLVK